jgi:hypothetical protein
LVIGIPVFQKKWSVVQVRRSEIAAVIERDLLRDDDDKGSDAIKCFSCGYGMVYRGSRFCSRRCRDWYDTGNPGYAQDWLKRQKANNAPMRYCIICCAHCKREFASIGLRCCSTDCEQRYRERQDNLRLIAEVGIEPSAKRKCECCGAVIPKWRKGRRVSRAARFCSDRCSRQARKLAA